MGYNSDRFIKIILAFVLTVTVLSLSYFWFEKYYISQRLNKELLKINGVLSADIKGKSSALTVSVLLDKTDNLQKSYTNVFNLVEGFTNGKEFNLIILDKKNSQTEKFADKVQLAIFESLNKHNYTWLNQIINEEAMKNNVDCRLWIDDKNMYLQIINDAGYQYIIIPAKDSDLNNKLST